MSFVGTAVLGAGVLGAGATIYGANQAAKAQENAADTAANTQMSMYNTTRGDLAPFRQIGTTAADQLTKNLADYTTPITMDQSTLEATPGYQFDLTQGLKATQNSAAARGLGTSGAALKGAAAFATGLADNTYQTQFNIANTNQSNAFNRLAGLVSTGENAAAQTGAAGTSAANGASSAEIGAGNAAAAGANATGGAVNSLANLTEGLGLASSKGGSSLFSSAPTAANTSGTANFNSGNPIY